MTDQDLVAAFLARGGKVSVASEGVAYGVSAEADKAKRQEARKQRRYEADESAYERHAEAVREAYHTGGRHAAIDAMQPRARRA